MIRNLRILGLTMVAMLAVGVVGASAASAASFHSESSETFVLGSQSTQNVFTVNSRTFKCSTVTFTGSFEGTSKSTLEEIHPEYGGCEAFGLEIAINTEGCNYTFDEPSGSGSESHTGTVNLVCATGHEIEMNTASGVCVVTVGSQSGLSSVTYTDEGSGSSRSVLVTANVSGISVDVSGSTLICGTNGTRSATYTGSVSTKGYTSEAHTIRTGIWVE
ncbi:MAG: hypothetical protein QM729_10840 [Solirubrobacterales bacterium]